MGRVGATASGTLTLNACKSEWNADTITYNTVPKLYTTEDNIVTNVLAASTSTSMSFDITNLVKRWTGILYNEQAEENYGFRLQYQSNAPQSTSCLTIDLCESITSSPYVEITHSAYEARNLYNGGVYYIRNKQTGGYLNLSDNPLAYEDMPAVNYPFRADYCSLWKLQYSDGFYKLRPVNEMDKERTLQNVSSEARIRELDSTGNSGFLWNIVKNADNLYKIPYRIDNGMKGLYTEAYGYKVLIGDIGLANSDWEFIPAFQNTGIYYLKNRQSGMYLGYDGSSNIRQFNKSTMGLII